VNPPHPTHDKDPQPSLFGNELEPWVTMAAALGWDPSEPVLLNPGVTDTQPHRRKYPLDVPAPTFAFGHDAANWCWERPSTTIVGSFRPMIVAGPGVDLTRPRQEREGSVRITPEDALVLQSFPRDYPVQGSVTKQYEQTGNAVPPLLAAHVLSSVTGIEFTNG